MEQQQPGNSRPAAAARFPHEHELANPNHARHRTNVRRTHFITKTLSKASFSSMEDTIFKPNPVKAHGTRDANAQQHTSSLKKNCPARKRRQFNRARRDAKTPKSETAEKKPSSCHTLTKQSTLQRSSTSRVHAQSHPHNVGY